MSKTVHQRFIDMITPYLPDPKEKEKFIEACTHPLKKSITINIARISAKEFIDMVTPRGWTLTPNRFKDQAITFYIDREDLSLALGREFLYQAGFFYIQEVAASLSALEIKSEPGDIILDMAAAPGGKTSQLANALLKRLNPGLVIANDVATPRIQTLAHNLNMQGCYNTAITKFNGFMFGKHLPEFFDHVLVDAPCSGEGTGFKSDYALKFRRQEEINKIAGTQFQLLVSAIKTTKPGGTIVYSTCTLNPYENELILARVLEFFKGSVELEAHSLHNIEQGHSFTHENYSFNQPQKVARLRPHRQQTGGFFVSKLRKVHTTNKEHKNNSIHKMLPKNQFKLITHKKLQKEIVNYCKDNYGISIDQERHFFIATKERVYLTSPSFMHIQKHIHCEKVGIPIFKIDRKTGYRPMHYFGLIFGHLATKNYVEFTNEEIQAYSEGKEIKVTHTLPPNASAYQIITRNDFGMSVTKKVGDGWKNKFGK